MDFLGMANLALSGIGTGFDLYGQREAREEAKKANKQRRIDQAWANLINAARGGGVSSLSTAQESVPDVNYGGALVDLGKSAINSAYSGRKANAEQADRAAAIGLDSSATDDDIRAATAQAYNAQQQRQAKLDELAGQYKQTMINQMTGSGGGSAPQGIDPVKRADLMAKIFAANPTMSPEDVAAIADSWLMGPSAGQVPAGRSSVGNLGGVPLYKE